MTRFDGSVDFSTLQDEGDLAPVRSGHRIVANSRSVIQQYWAMAFRWRKPLLATVIGFILAGIIVTFLMTPQYTASSLIEIAREGNRIAPVQGVEREATDQDLEFYQTQYGLLQSNELAESVVDELKLADNAAFFDMFGVRPQGRNADGVLDPAKREARRKQAGEALLKRISINPVRLSRLVNVSFTSPDRVLSAKIVNAWVKRFIRTTLERRYEATSYARSFLESRLGQLRTRVEESERQLVDFASRERLINIPAADGAKGAGGGERSILAENLAALNAELTQAEADRIRQGSRLDSARNGAVPEALQNTAIAGLRQRRAELAAEYQKMMVQFEPQYPAAQALKSQIDKLDESISREQSRVSESIRNNYRDSSVREAELGRNVDRLKNELLDQRRRTIQYNIYQREADTNRQLYDALLQRYKEIGVASGVGVNNISVVDEADVPTRPSSPRLLLNLILSIIAGLGAGALLVFILEQTADAFDDPAQVGEELHIPLLGVTPKVPENATNEAILDRKSSLTEAYLSVETNLRFSTNHGLPRSLSVTSSRPAEGKSTTALAVATLLARAGKRVLLVDGDMRKPSLHVRLGLVNTAGLSDYLVGARPLGELLHKVDRFGLTAMPSGPQPPNAAELLVSDRFGEVVAELCEQFDHVVIDSPPIMGLADALLIGSRVEGVLFAIQAHGISRRMATVALQRLRNAHVRVFGGVLVRFETKRSHLGYGYDYGYGYGREGDLAEDAKA
ncbi:GumC family protein [Sphingomonas kyeonggiensis]|uniref:non-specific protein-tyrosine kinase n=1 Tax=Sphingomonas kyeonggiensis TaxID=1268553 RepID=A0A7W6NY22_9SPHN|nr:polysaccharide biosynthesis tyrosine autokinase [Sphingomonas kyeonggiensis]MBB4099923.1 capsular exopolysaccharide synthesis family protein [Sphingomonas kyeonggiensis]